MKKSLYIEDVPSTNIWTHPYLSRSIELHVRPASHLPSLAFRAGGLGVGVWGFGFGVIDGARTQLTDSSDRARSRQTARALALEERGSMAEMTAARSQRSRTEPARSARSGRSCRAWCAAARPSRTSVHRGRGSAPQSLATPAFMSGAWWVRGA
jgi:hypothetical protein